MQRILLAFCVVALLGSSTRSENLFERFFLDKTLRVDLYHSGTSGSESFSLDRSLLEGSWPGSRVNLIDTMSLGEY
ncbi:MAG: peptidase M64 N-terminal domain-containing protein, partial [Bacteroidota bacterium]